MVALASEAISDLVGSYSLIAFKVMKVSPQHGRLDAHMDSSSEDRNGRGVRDSPWLAVSCVDEAFLQFRIGGKTHPDLKMC